MWDRVRNDRVKKLHIDSFNWRAERIPFGVWVNDTRKYREIRQDDADFDRKLFERQMTILEDTMELGSDLVPVLGITNYGIAIVPSLFGAEIKCSSFDVDRIEEMGYWIHRIIDRTEEIDGLKAPKMRSELFDDVLGHLEYYRENKPGWVTISNSLDGPFSIAELLRGPEIYFDIYDGPEYVHKLMGLCTDAVIDCEKKLRKAAGHTEEVGEFPTYFGIWSQGLRFGDDSIINLSGDMIREFVVPYYEKIAKSFKCKVEVHFCTVNKLIGTQIFEAFAGCEDIICVSTQLGAEYYMDKKEELRGRLAVEAGYGEAVRYHQEKSGSFKKWAKTLKEGHLGTSGLILYTTVGSADEGRRLLDDWNSVWGI